MNVRNGAQTRLTGDSTASPDGMRRLKADSDGASPEKNSAIPQKNEGSPERLPSPSKINP